MTTLKQTSNITVENWTIDPETKLANINVLFSKIKQWNFNDTDSKTNLVYPRKDNGREFNAKELSTVVAINMKEPLLFYPYKQLLQWNDEKTKCHPIAQMDENDDAFETEGLVYAPYIEIMPLSDGRILWGQIITAFIEYFTTNVNEYTEPWTSIRSMSSFVEPCDQDAKKTRGYFLGNHSTYDSQIECTNSITRKLFYLITFC